MKLWKLLVIVSMVVAQVIPLRGFAASGDLIWGVTVDPSGSTDYGEGVALYGSEIYVVGMKNTGGSSPYNLMRIEKRRTSDGSLVWGQDSAPGIYNGGYDIAVDSTGVYVAGYTTIGTDTQWRVEKRSLADGSLVWGQNINPTASREDYSRGIVVDGTGVYIVGQDVDTVANKYRWHIEKRDKNTGASLWVQAGAAGTAYDVAIDSTGLYVAGSDVVTGNYQWRIEKRNLSTGASIWTQTVNPTASYDEVRGVAVDGTGAYVVGYDSVPGVGDYQWRIEKRDLSTGASIWTQAYNNSIGQEEARGVISDGTAVYIIGRDSIPGNDQFHLESRSAATGALTWVSQSNLSASPETSDSIVYDGSGVYFAGSTAQDWRIEKHNKGGCTGPFATSWTDPTLTANSTKIRKVHIDELRSAIDTRRVDAGLAAYSWTDPTLTANSTMIRKVHIDELRTAISQVYSTCGQAAPSWTDPTLTANSTKIRKVHIDELRTTTANAL